MRGTARYIDVMLAITMGLGFGPARYRLEQQDYVFRNASKSITSSNGLYTRAEDIIRRRVAHYHRRQYGGADMWLTILRASICQTVTTGDASPECRLIRH